MTRTRILLAVAVVAALAAVAYAFTRDGGTPSPTTGARAGARDVHAAVEPPTVERLPMPALQYDDDPPGDQRLEGQVIDQDEQPVAGATVMVDANPPREVATEADGSFAIDGLTPRTYQLEARAGDGLAGPVSVRLARNSEPVVLRLHPAAALRVEVLGDGDAPLVGALVELRDLAAITATTDAEGHAVLRGVGGGWHVVKASAAGYAADFREITSSGHPGDETRLTFRLRAGVAVGGTVVDGAGAPVEGARVLPEGLTRLDVVHDPRLDSVVTDAKGRWRLTGLPRETLRVRAYHPAFAPGWTSPVPLGDGVDRDDLTIVLERGARIAGRVVDAGGAPVPGAEVRIGSDDRRAGPVRRAACAADGRFELTGLPRRLLRVIAVADEATSSIASVDLSRGPAEDLELRLDLADAIAGVVVTSAGEPVPEARVVAQPSLGDDPLARATRRLRGAGTAIADGDGHFRITGVPKGTYLVRAVRPGSPSELLEMRLGDRVEAGATEVRIVVDDLATLAGKVAFADGTTPAQFSVQLGGSGPRTFVGDRFEIEGVPLGKQYLLIDGPELVDLPRKDVEITRDGVTDLGTIVVQRGRRITGRVVDVAGRGVAGADVVAARQLNADGAVLVPYPQSVEQTFTDRDGGFALRGLGPGAYVLVADHDAAGRSGVQELPAGGGDAELTLTVRPTGAVEGFVRVDGQPASAFVVLRAADAPNAAFVVDTGPDGSYRLDRVGAGAYMLWVGLARGDRLGEGGTSRSMVVESGKVTSIDVDIVGKGVDVMLHMTSAGDAVAFGYGAIASVPPGTDLPLPKTLSEGRGMLVSLTSSTSREGLIVEDRQLLLPQVEVGRNIACISPLSGDPSDPSVLAELEHDIIDWPVYCKWFDIPASPDHQDITIEVQPLPR